ncbi:DUF494 domain-containing protein [bacterium]|nr:DUF494 domain-containing protein [bacterium]MBU1984995.1 DUF494 domain-containing protein [bacterium]
MDQRIVEILMYVIGELQSRRIRIEEIEGISDELMQRGFSQREVSTAISVFADRLLTESKRTFVAFPAFPYAHRVLHDLERQYVSPEAYGYLIEMARMSILDHEDVEEIIERCVLLGNLNVGGDEMKVFVATHLLEKDPCHKESSLNGCPTRPWPERVH